MKKKQYLSLILLFYLFFSSFSVEASPDDSLTKARIEQGSKELKALIFQNSINDVLGLSHLNSYIFGGNEWLTDDGGLLDTHQEEQIEKLLAEYNNKTSSKTKLYLYLGGFEGWSVANLPNNRRDYVKVLSEMDKNKGLPGVDEDLKKYKYVNYDVIRNKLIKREEEIIAKIAQNALGKKTAVVIGITAAFGHNYFSGTEKEPFTLNAFYNVALTEDLENDYEYYAKKLHSELMEAAKLNGSPNDDFFFNERRRYEKISAMLVRCIAIMEDNSAPVIVIMDQEASEAAIYDCSTEDYDQVLALAEKVSADLLSKIDFWGSLEPPFEGAYFFREVKVESYEKIKDKVDLLRWHTDVRFYVLSYEIPEIKGICAGYFGLAVLQKLLDQGYFNEEGIEKKTIVSHFYTDKTAYLLITYFDESGLNVEVSQELTNKHKSGKGGLNQGKLLDIYKDIPKPLATHLYYLSHNGFYVRLTSYGKDVMGKAELTQFLIFPSPYLDEYRRFVSQFLLQMSYFREQIYRVIKINSNYGKEARQKYLELLEAEAEQLIKSPTKKQLKTIHSNALLKTQYQDLKRSYDLIEIFENQNSLVKAMDGSAKFDADNMTAEQRKALEGIRFEEAIIPNMHPEYLLVKIPSKTNDEIFYSPFAEQFIQNYIYEKFKNLKIKDNSIAKKFEMLETKPLEAKYFKGGVDIVRYEEKKDILETLSLVFTFVPVVSELMDLGLAAYSYSQGDYWGAATGVIVTIPVVGDIGKVLKLPLGKAFGSISKRVNDWFSFGKKAKNLNIDAVDEIAKKFNTKDKKQVENFIDAKGDGFKLPDNDDGWKRLRNEFDEWSFFNQNPKISQKLSKKEKSLFFSDFRGNNDALTKFKQNEELVEGWKKLDKLGESELRKDINFLNSFDEVIKNEKLNKHIFKGEVRVIGYNDAGNPIYRITGIHSNKAFADGKVRIKPNTPINPIKNGYYDARVQIRIEGFVNDTGTNWKVKKEKSTFFPDAWSIEKIQKEITVALLNKNSKFTTNSGRLFSKGRMSDGTLLSIYEFNGVLETVFPSFKE